MAEEKFIDKIRIKNFKGFVDESFSFQERFTVVIGDNGTGKTALLDSIAVVCSTLNIARGKWHQEIWKNVVRRESRPQGRVQYMLPVEITASRESRAVYHEWQYIRTGQRKGAFSFLNPSPFFGGSRKENMLTQTREGRGIIQPVQLFYGIDRLEHQWRSGVKMPQRAFGFNILTREEEGYNYISQSNYVSRPRPYGDRISDEGVCEAVRQALGLVVAKWSRVYFSERENEIVGQFEGDSEKWLPFRTLSAGYRNLVGLVADIAYHCIKLNGHLGVDTIVNTPGIVLIDELDLHLHPKWQKEVVDDLKRAFPLVQFVVTTHSPFIVQSLKAEELINLNEEESTATTDPFRQSIEEISEEEMLVPDVERSQRFKEMQETAAEYFRLIRQGETSENNGNVRELKLKLDELESRYSDDPAYVALLKAERNSAAHEAGH